MVPDSDGDGLEFMAQLKEKSKEATAGDRSLVNTRFAGLVRDGIVGELTTPSLTAHLKEYKEAKGDLSDEAQLAATRGEIEMMAGIAFEDATVSAEYESKAATRPPLVESGDPLNWLQLSPIKPSRKRVMKAAAKPARMKKTMQMYLHTSRI